MLTKEYLGGFIDSEACIGLYKKKNSYNLEIQISQTKNDKTLPLLEYIKKVYGGGIVGPSQYGKQAPWIKFRIGNLKALAMLKDLYPYLYLKKEQATIGIKFYTREIVGIEAAKMMKDAKHSTLNIDDIEYTPSVPDELRKDIAPEQKQEIIETPIPEEYPVIVTEEKPVESMGWCMLNVAHPFAKGKNYRVFKMTWEDENGTPVVDKKWACPKCIEHYTTIGRGRVSFEMEPNKDVSSAPAF